MAVQHLHFDDQTEYGRQLRRALNLFGEGYESLNDLLGMMPFMIDGDTAVEANYTNFASRFGFADNATAKGAFDEMNSLMAKLNTDNSVTSVKSAIAQALNKLG